MRWALAFTALAIGAMAGLAAVLFWGYGPLVAVGLLGVTARVFAKRRRWAELPWALVGAGLVPVAILWGAVSNTDTTIRFSPETAPAFALATATLIAGIVLAAAGMLIRARASHDDRGANRPLAR
ncbi:MAG: hypothetical protein ACRDGL_04600 [Candidatus Limnocylindrales bacterium]